MTRTVGGALPAVALGEQLADTEAIAKAARTMAQSQGQTIGTLAQFAQQYGTTAQAADAIHQQLQTEINALQAGLAAVTTTPGPPGDSAYDIARALGYGGTKTQWIASLKGADGAQGQQGVKGDTGAAGTASLALGAAPVGLLALGGSTNVTVGLSRTMPNATYTVQPVHSAVVSLANVTLTVTARTTTSVTVRVTSVGLALAAGTLIVAAY